MIRLSQPLDFDFFYDMYFHTDINPYLLYEMMDKPSFRPIYDDLSDKKLLYVFEKNGQQVGMFKLIPLTYRCSHIAYLGGLAIHPDFGGKGYGSAMMQAIIKYGQQLGLKRIELSVASINYKARHMYAKAGFEEEGVLRNYTYLQSENKYLDEVLMSYLYPI